MCRKRGGYSRQHGKEYGSGRSLHALEFLRPGGTRTLGSPDYFGNAAVAAGW